MRNAEQAGFFDRVRKGLEESALFSRGQLTLRTTQAPLPPPPISSKRVRALRRRLNMSQSIFAAALNVSPKLVQSWEQGRRKPARGDLRLMQIIERKPSLMEELLEAVS